tara:strand:+ start:14823 stop:15797 length:975 start_codon:yes stop_codon:yes gene_type:complete
MAEYTRIHRLLKVLTLIQSGQKHTPAELAQECGVEQRTIFRDLKELEGAGFQIKFDSASKMYRIEKDCFLPPVQLTAQEALAMAALCEHIAEPEQIPFTKPAWKGLAKVQAAMPQSVRDELYEISSTVSIKTAQSGPQDGFTDIYETIQQAIADRMTLVCQYDSLSVNGDDPNEFDFEPYTLLFSVRAWYAIGYHHERNDIRTLKLNRFTKAVRTNLAFEIPSEFSIDAHLGNAWRMMRGKDQKIELWFSPEFAETISDTIWHKTQEIDDHEDGSATMRCTVSGFNEIVWWILSMGPNCKVIKPVVLQERVLELAKSTASLYQD